jgi:hypothetical protein
LHARQELSRIKRAEIICFSIKLEVFSKEGVDVVDGAPPEYHLNFD